MIVNFMSINYDNVMFYVCLSYILVLCVCVCVCVCVHVFLTETSLYLVLHND